MRLREITAVLLVACCVVSSQGASLGPIPPEPIFQSSDSSNKPPAWDRKAAAKYLDDRMDLWFAKASKLQTGGGRTTCVSCHITVPYVLVRRPYDGRWV